MAKDQNQSNNGRWTDEEHNLFLKGLEQYGKNWKLIEKLIKSRTGSQIRSHAQKYYLKLQKSSKSDKKGDRKHSQAKRVEGDLEIKLEDPDTLSESEKQKLSTDNLPKVLPHVQGLAPNLPIYQQSSQNIDLEFPAQYYQYPIYHLPQQPQYLQFQPYPFPQQTVKPGQMQQNVNQTASSQQQLQLQQQQQPLFQQQQFLQPQYFMAPKFGYNNYPIMYTQQQLAQNAYMQQVYSAQMLRGDQQKLNIQLADGRKFSESMEQFSTADDASAEPVKGFLSSNSLLVKRKGSDMNAFLQQQQQHNSQLLKDKQQKINIPSNVIC